MLVKEVLNRDYDAKLDGGRLSTTKMISYYCSTVQKGASINMKSVKHNVYVISSKRLKEMKPFSMRLQAEELREQGIIPNEHNVRDKSKYTLQAGHSRYPSTEKAMAKRREIGRKNYERYIKQQQSLNEGSKDNCS